MHWLLHAPTYPGLAAGHPLRPLDKRTQGKSRVRLHTQEGPSPASALAPSLCVW